MAKFEVGAIVDINLDYGRIRAARIAEVSNAVDWPGQWHDIAGVPEQKMKNVPIYKVEIPFPLKNLGEFTREDGKIAGFGGPFTGEIWIPEVYVEPLEDEKFAQTWKYRP